MMIQPTMKVPRAPAAPWTKPCVAARIRDWKIRRARRLTKTARRSRHHDVHLVYRLDGSLDCPVGSGLVLMVLSFADELCVLVRVETCRATCTALRWRGGP